MVYAARAILTATLALSAAAPILAVPLPSTPGNNGGHGHLVRAPAGPDPAPDLELGQMGQPNTGEVSPNTGEVPPNTGEVSPNTGEVPPNTGAVSPNTGAVSPNTGEVSPNRNTGATAKAVAAAGALVLTAVGTIGALGYGAYKLGLKYISEPSEGGVEA